MNQSLLELSVGIGGENEITQGALRAKSGCQSELLGEIYI